MKTVLIATDGSEPADEALDYAIEIAHAMRATLHVLSVERPPAPGSTSDGAALVDDARAIAEAGARRARSAGVETTAHTSHGEVAASIESAAAALGADLLVVGSRRLADRAGGAAGSVSHALVRDARMPVTVVHRGDAHAGSPTVPTPVTHQVRVARDWSMFE
jgi:nucleotide-binding universal stress UspA family protein